VTGLAAKDVGEVAVVGEAQLESEGRQVALARGQALERGADA
jgi:hypothetical protein